MSLLRRSTRRHRSYLLDLPWRRVATTTADDSPLILPAMPISQEKLPPPIFRPLMLQGTYGGGASRCLRYQTELVGFRTFYSTYLGGNIFDAAAAIPWILPAAPTLRAHYFV